MPWVTIGESFITKNKWYFTQPVAGELFRIKHQVSSTNKYIKAMVAPAFIDDGVNNILTPHGLSYRNESEIFTFQIPNIEVFSLAFRRLDSTNVAWKVFAEVFEGYSATDEISKEVIAAMSNIYSRGNGANLKPESGDKNLSANTIATLVADNKNRAYLTIRVGNEGISLFADKDEEGNGVNLIEELAPGEVYNLPLAGGIYRGDIYALAENGTSVSFTEFVD